MSDFSIKSLITDRIGRHEVLLSFSHKYYNFQGSKKVQKAGEKFGTLSILLFCLKFWFTDYIELCDWFIENEVFIEIGLSNCPITDCLITSQKAD